MPSLRARQNPPLHFKEDSSSILSGEDENESPFGSDNDTKKTPRNKNRNNKRQAKTPRDSEKKRQNANGKPSKPKKVESEEDIYALPLGTSDEEEEEYENDDEDSGLEDFTPRVRRTRESGQTKTLEEKLAMKDDDADETENHKSMSKSPGSGRKRKSHDMLGSDDKEQMFSMWSQQRSGKRQSQGYGSKYRKTPASSFVDSLPPSSSAPQPNSSATSVEQQEESEDEKLKGTAFRVPREINAEAVLSDPEIADSEDDDSPLSSAVSYDSPDSVLKNEGDAEEGKDDYDPQDYLCPMCKEPVPRGELLLFQAQTRQRFRDQEKFCQSHKQGRAEREWEEKGYPTIDWNKFEKRLQKHFRELEKLMVPESSSFYRNVLATAVDKQKGKNFKLTLAGDELEKISCGYYGTRGSELMLQVITTRYGRKLRRLAAEDHIVKQAGVVGYCQTVLVPELAVRLIKEDMTVDDESARQIMRDSIAVGEKLNPAPNDVVPRDADDDEHAN